MPRIVIDNSQTALSLESQLEHLAMESEYFANVIKAFREVVPNVVQTVREKLGLLGDNKDVMVIGTPEFRKDYVKLDSRVRDANFLTYEKTLVQVPEGFKGNLVEYFELLLKLSPVVYANGLELLTEYNSILANFISNKEAKLALKDHTNFFKKVDLQREDMSNSILQFFTNSANDSNRSLAPLGKTLGRFADIKMIHEYASKLESSYNIKNAEQIQAAVRHSAELLDVLIKNVANESVENVSGAAAKNIAEGAYTMGKYVEFVAVYRFRTIQAEEAFFGLVKGLNELLK